jgi:hypothetical protein
LAALAGLAAPGCKQTDESRSGARGEVSQEVTAQASVQQIDPADRTITLQREDGTTFVVQAGPEVVNFDQIAVGDVLRVRYVESLAASLKDPDDTVQPASATLAAGAAEPGQKPGAAIGQQLNATVRIESVDTEQDIVVFTTPDGELRSARVVRPEGREFIEKLKPGDQVEITYTEALAISIERE